MRMLNDKKKNRCPIAGSGRRPRERQDGELRQEDVETPASPEEAWPGPGPGAGPGAGPGRTSQATPASTAPVGRLRTPEPFFFLNLISSGSTDESYIEKITENKLTHI